MKKLWPVLAFLLLIDIVSKYLAQEYVPHLVGGPYPFGGIGIFSFGGITCSLNFITNSGAAWGLFTGFPGLLFILRVLIIAALCLFSPKRFSVWLILTGAVGNAIDYCLYGKVIDFIHFTFWGYSFPIFNVADSCITLGVLSLFLFSKGQNRCCESQALK